MTFESIPGCILQVLAVLRVLAAGQQPTTAAMISILISALTTGYTSAVMTFDHDVDPVRRVDTPDFYGMVPDETLSRTIVFVCLVLQSALLLLIRSVGAALLIKVDKRFLATYMVLDHALHWLYRLARNDAWTFINVTGPLGVMVTFVARTTCKVVVDFTGLVQFRGAGILGGIYWTLNMVMAFLASFVAIYVYFETFEEKDAGIKRESAYQIAAGISGAWLVVSVVFLSLIKKEYIGTFYSTQTGNEYVQNKFLKGETDQIKAKILNKNPHCWKSIRPQVRGWLLENWYMWEDEKPEWFDEVFMSWVDDDMMPPDALMRLRQKGGGSRRRSSIGQKVGGSVRERRRSSATIVPIGENDQEAGRS